MYAEVAQLMTSMGVGPDAIRRACDLGGGPELVFYRAPGVHLTREISRRLLEPGRRPGGGSYFGASEPHEARFLVEFWSPGRVVDFGAIADGRGNACLFLPVAAALSRVEAPGPFDDRGALDAVAPHLVAAAATPIDALERVARPAGGRDPVGRFAEVLRSCLLLRSL